MVVAEKSALLIVNLLIWCVGVTNWLQKLEFRRGNQQQEDPCKTLVSSQGHEILNPCHGDSGVEATEYSGNIFGSADRSS